MSKKYVIIRSRDAGVFAGELVRRQGDTVTLRNSRRIWYWAGANTLSELALRGTAKPDECKFPVAIPNGHIVLGVCEIIPVSAVARRSIEAVPEWVATQEAEL